MFVYDIDDVIGFLVLAIVLIAFLVHFIREMLRRAKDAVKSFVLNLKRSKNERRNG